MTTDAYLLLGCRARLGFEADKVVGQSVLRRYHGWPQGYRNTPAAYSLARQRVPLFRVKQQFFSYLFPVSCVAHIEVNEDTP